MGAVADTVLDAGGTVTGVITEQLRVLEVGHDTLTELDVVGNMHARRREWSNWQTG